MTKERGTRGGGQDYLFEAAERFTPGGRVAQVREFGNGNVNDTFLVSPGESADNRFILQRLNRRVFRRPELVMQNLRVLCDHVAERLGSFAPAVGRRWEIPRVLPARDFRDYWIGPDGSFWRAMSFIRDAQAPDTVRDSDHAREIGFALGLFHGLLSDLPAEKLGDTLEGFHVTPLYLARYKAVLAAKELPATRLARLCADFIDGRGGGADVLEKASAGGKLLLRPIHGDPKANNILLDNETRRAVAIVDLDTVKPGLIHYDIGDCLRSCCNPLGEETDDWEAVSFEPDLCREILRGYFSSAGGYLGTEDREYIHDAVRLIAFELGLRFFTDYLEGDVYFKVRREGQNLSRALVQFKLVESIESLENSIRQLAREPA